MSKNHMVAFCAIAFLICSGLPCSYATDAKSETPKELLQYVHDATALGLDDAQIKQRATAAGWSSAAVAEAIATARTTTSPQPASGDPSKIEKHTDPVPQPSTPNTPVPESKPAPIESASASGTIPPRPAVAAPTALPLASPDEYVIGAGDVLQISVWKEPEASVPSVVVRPDGKISLPLVKETTVAGLTPKQAGAVVADRLAKFIPDADVTVVVSGINSKKIYVVGAVKKEGPIPYTYRMTIMQALSEAGGLTDYAKRKKIYVLRTSGGTNEKLSFDFSAVLRGEHMESNVPLLPNDTVIVPH